MKASLARALPLLLRPQTPPVHRASFARLCTASSNLPSAVQSVLESDLNHLPPGAPLLVSVSGGADSVALFRVLLALNPRWRWKLQAVHFNHGLRAESDAEEAFVRSLAEEHDVPLHVRRLAPTWSDDSAEDAKADSVGVQERTRTWRRAESLSILSELEASSSRIDKLRLLEDGVDEAAEPPPLTGAIALGHHADDQVETILLKALRGCHLANLHGMRVVDGPFVRPLLSVRKQELVSYLEGMGQVWMEDASNQQPKYKRNKVRLQLVPLLEELSGGADALLSRMEAAERQSSTLRAWLDDECAAHLAKDPHWKQQRGLSIKRLLSAPLPLQEELLHTLVQTESDGASLSYSTLTHLLDQLKESTSVEWKLDVTRQCTVQRVGDVLRASGSSSSSSSAEDGGNEVLEVGTVSLTVPKSWKVTSGWEHANVGAYAVEADAPDAVVARLYNLCDGGHKLEMRTWREGDRFHPSWKTNPSSLVSFLRGQEMPLEMRREVPLVCREGTSEVLAVLSEGKVHVAKGHQGGGGESEEAAALVVGVAWDRGN